MAKKMRITESKSLAIFTAIQHVEETLDAKVIPAGFEVDVTNCGDLPIYIHLLGQIEIIETKKRHKFCSAVHLTKDATGNWAPKFVDAQIDMNGKDGREAEMKMSSAEWREGKKYIHPEPTEEQLKSIAALWL